MAYFQKNNNNEDQNQNQNTTSNTGGNTYSVSSSEVSSTVDNNENNKKSDTGSGNFVNLTKYLDSNQGKMGNYANTFVQDDLNKGQDYRGNIQNSQENYISSINSDSAASYNKDSDNKILENYLKDSSSVKDSDKQRATNILKGYQGADYFENTGDEFGYNTLKKDSDNFNTLSGNITNQDYLKTQMSNDLSSGGKNLDSFLLGANKDSSKVLNDASKEFSDLASLLDATTTNLNQQRDTVVNKATENQKAFDKARQDKVTELGNQLRAKYNNGESKYKSSQAYRQDYDNIWALPYGSSGDGYAYYYQDNSNNAKSQLDRELAELNNRSNSLSGSEQLNGNSKLDSDFNFYNWVAPTEQQKQIQSTLAKDFDNTFGIYAELLMDKYPSVVDKSQALKLAYMRGDLTKDQVQQYFDTMPEYIREYIPEELWKGVAPENWRSFRRANGIGSI